MPRAAVTHKKSPRLVYDALEFALLAHEGHFRKHKRVPYIVHPLRIFATLALELGVSDEATLAAAILHDTIEDTRTDYDDLRKQFGAEVADLVAHLTKDTRLPEELREEQFLRQVAGAPLAARLVKLADNYDNLLDSRALPPDRRRDAARRKQPHVESLCASLPEEHRAFAEKVRELLARCLE